MQPVGVPGNAVNEPGLHTLHMDIPAMLYVPAGHATGSVSPVALQAKPASHVTHADSSGVAP